MNIKTFAQQSREILMDGVAKRLIYWGFSSKGDVLESPKKISGGYNFRGEVKDNPKVPELWEALRKAIVDKGIDTVVEEAAYTWFNRIMALRIMAKNGYEPSLLQNAEGLDHTPLLLQRARQGQYAFLEPATQDRLKRIIGDYTKDQEAFAMLLVGYCQSNITLNNVFGRIDDYTELLLPDNMLQDSGFLHLLNTTDAISDEEYQQVELIGWLYQFYISAKKDEVFASFTKGKKAEAKDIPAATQIFTPNWIVKYMVENTAGKIWLDKNPYSSLRGIMKYLVAVEEASEETVAKNPLISSVEELTLLDPAVGSGHILVEGFDLLYAMYMEEYYAPEEAVESILKNNLYGLDIDTRAVQLANFAILLKAAKKYRDVFSKGWMPRVYAMPDKRLFSKEELKDFLGEEGSAYLEDFEKAMGLMKDAKNLGSIMQLHLEPEAREFISRRFKELQQASFLDFRLQAVLKDLHDYIPVLLTLTQQYTAVVANPPYMGQKNMNADLKKYVNENYVLTKSDLFAVFMEVALQLSLKNGFMGMINQESWMFLPSYKRFRKKVLNNNSIINLLHLGTKAFEEVKGEKVRTTSFVLRNQWFRNSKATYCRLVDYKNTVEKETNFLKKNNFYYQISQSNFNKIPESPIAYWASAKCIDIFEKKKALKEIISTKQGMATGDNDKFLRYWFEISRKEFNNSCQKFEDVFNLNQKWLPYNKGGKFKKWYGNYELVISFDYDSFRILSKQGNKCPSRHLYFKKSLTWTLLVSTTFGCKFQSNQIFDVNGLSAFPNDEYFHYTFGLMCSKISYYFLSKINPTLAFQKGNVDKIPYVIDMTKERFIQNFVELNVSLSKKDWDSREISWDFEQSPLFNNSENIAEAYKRLEKDATQDFFQLHKNEEELNRIFIDIYGLQEELTPEVALKDITVLQEELKAKDLEDLEPEFRAKGAEGVRLPINKQEVISQFISYAIGVFMGRYRLDKPGLHIAHPNPSLEEIKAYSFNGQNITIDEDGIIPLMGRNSNFPDDALLQITHLLDAVWGHDTRTQNLNFIQQAINKDLEDFLVKDFYKYHCGMYKEKPIYWLFSSPKGAFQVLVYMHRMNAFTVEKIRSNYLMEHIRNIRSSEAALVSRESSLSTQESRQLDRIRKDILECETYDMELKEVADAQIVFDLDDGVDVNYAKFGNVLAKIK